MKISRILVALAVLILGAGISACQTWQPLAHQPAFSPGVVLLLTDGTILAHSEPNCLSCTSTDYTSWYKLTPDSNGSYVNGTWSQAAAPTGYAPLYFGSAVLPDGRVVAEGGEYDCSTGSCQAAWTNQGAIYNPLKNSWTTVQPPSGWKTIGDAQSVVLPNGTYMQANCCTRDEALFNAATLTWTAARHRQVRHPRRRRMDSAAHWKSADGRRVRLPVRRHGHELRDLYPVDGSMGQCRQHDRATVGLLRRSQCRFV